MYNILIIGGGAAGYFTAVNLKEAAPELSVAILERSDKPLAKVLISGGGRCNVTHGIFDPKELIDHYPRGRKELLGPFHRFMTGDTMEWFENRGVALKIEEDGRVFPVSDNSESIANCLTEAAANCGVEVLLRHGVKRIEPIDEGFLVSTNQGDLRCLNLVVASGSSPKMWKQLAHLGHTIVSPVPSLFTFNISDPIIADLAGVSTLGRVQVLDDRDKVLMEDQGPILITHWGLSGPAVLKLSAWGARLLFDLDYRFKIRVSWVDCSTEECMEVLNHQRLESPKKQLSNTPLFDLPKRLWTRLVHQLKEGDATIWAHARKEQLTQLASLLTACPLEVGGKSTFKEEFVTAGGVALGEIDFRRYESKLIPGLYMAGEVLDIDAITGGFNFQNAWTGGYIIAQALSGQA